MKVKWLIHRHSTVFRQIAPCSVNCGHLCITLKPFSNFSTAFASRQQMNFEREKNASSSYFPSSSSILINKLLFWTLEWKKTRLHCEPKAFALASLANCLALWSKLKWLYADTNTATIKNAKIYSILLAQKKSHWKPLAFFLFYKMNCQWKYITAHSMLSSSTGDNTIHLFNLRLSREPMLCDAKRARAKRTKAPTERAKWEKS